MREKLHSEREKWSALDKKQKKQYFLDYYLFYTIVGAVILFVILFLAWHFLKPKVQNVLYVAVFDENLNEDEVSRLEGLLAERFGTDSKKQKILIDDSFYSREDGFQKMQIYARNSQVDVVIAPPEVFDVLAGFGFMQPVREVLGDEAEKYQERLYEAAGYRESDSISFEDNETGQGEPMDYGIRIMDSTAYTMLEPAAEEAVLGFMVDMPNGKNAVEFFQVLEE